MHRILKSNNGFSLLEVIIALGLFVVVLAITSKTMNTIMTQGFKVEHSEESNIEGVIGLEMLRHDIAQAGFGLFTDDSSIPAYVEATSAPASTYNDASNVPRAVVAGDNLNSPVLQGTDYLALKATTLGEASTLGRAHASQLWTYVTDDGIPKQWNGGHVFADNTDRVIVLDQAYDKSVGLVVRKLVMQSSDNYAVAYNSGGSSYFRGMDDATYENIFTPATNKRFYLYGITTAAAGKFGLSAPFNRTDYYVQRIVGGEGGVPASCSPATGVLYKGVMPHAAAGGSLIAKRIPVMDCVANMQVVLGWNMQVSPERSNAIDVLSNADGTATATAANGSNPSGLTVAAIMANPAEVRTRLRQVKVYILAQDGQVDRNFTNTNTALPMGDEGALVGIVDLTQANMLHYRWKLYRVVVRPRNLN